MIVRRPSLAWIALAASLCSGAVASLLVGRGDIADPELGLTFLRLRAWRLGCCVLAGAALACAGVLVQGLFRNPLASPSILGTTAGASLGGVSVLLLWDSLIASQIPRSVPPELVLPLGCLAGAWLSLVVLLAIVRRGAGPLGVLLTGFVLSSLFLSVGSFLMSLSQERWELGRAVVAFTLGGVESKGPRHVALALPLVGAGVLAAFGWRRHLDVLLSGEEEAQALGVDVSLVRRWVIAWTATLTAAAVAIGGNVTFVGLVVPHIMRSFVGVTHAVLLPAALVGGAAFVTWADVLARVLPARGAVPLGVITGLVGAPIFLVLLARAGRAGRIA